LKADSKAFNETQDSLHKVVSLILFSAIFINGAILFGPVPFDGYTYYIIAILFIPYFVITKGLPKMPLVLLVLPTLIGIVNLAMGNNELYPFIKISGGFLLLLVFYYCMIEYFGRNVKRIFNIYVSWAVVAAFIGIFQIIFYIIGFKPGYDFGWIFNKWAIMKGSIAYLRINSFFSEPSQYAITMAPITFLAIRRIIGENMYGVKLSRFSAMIVLMAYIFTTSSVAYFGIIIMFVILLLEKGRLTYLLALLFIAPLFMYVIYANVPEVRFRMDALYGLAVENDYSIGNVNSSSFVLYNHFHVAMQNLIDHPLGSGLGSHQFAFDKYSLTKGANIFELEFNKTDANSTLLRLTSELGFLGFFFALFVMYRPFVSIKSGGIHGLISTSLIVLILLHMFRQGNYFINGFPFFVLLYYYNGLEARSKAIEDLDEPEQQLVTSVRHG
jgi:hypothetical protein